MPDIVSLDLCGSQLLRQDSFHFLADFEQLSYGPVHIPAFPLADHLHDQKFNVREGRRQAVPLCFQRSDDTFCLIQERRLLRTGGLISFPPWGHP